MAEPRQNQNDQSNRSRQTQSDDQQRSGAMTSPGDRQRGMQQREQQSSPLDAMRRMSDEMDHTFDRILSSWGFPPLFGSRRRSGEQTVAMWAPRIEVFQKGDQFVIRAELPGLKKDEVEVNITDEAVTIQGQRRDEHEGQEGGVYHSERSYGSFYRSIPLPEGVMGDRADASFENGVLEIRIPSPPAEVRRGRKIEIGDRTQKS